MFFNWYFFRQQNETDFDKLAAAGAAGAAGAAEAVEAAEAAEAAETAEGAEAAGEAETPIQFNFQSPKNFHGSLEIWTSLENCDP